MTVLCERQPRASNAGQQPTRRRRRGQDNDTSRKSWAEAQGWNSHGPDSLSGIRRIQSARGRGQIGAQNLTLKGMNK